jgi:hypothetical protein
MAVMLGNEQGKIDAAGIQQARARGTSGWGYGMGLGKTWRVVMRSSNGEQQHWAEAE